MQRLIPVAACALLLTAVTSAHGDVRGTLFESPDFASGQPFTGDAGWVQASFAGADHQIVANGPRVAAFFGQQSLRISNAAINSGFGNQTRSAAVVDAAGERSATNDGLAGGVRRTRMVASFLFASAGLSAAAQPPQQPGLDVAVSPSNIGGGGRMGFVRVTDQPDGLKVVWTDFGRDTHGQPGFIEHVVATGLSRATDHLLVMALAFNDGHGDDVAKIAVDGGKAVTATTWEDYYRQDEHREPPAVNLLLFQTRTAAVPALAGQGLLFDDVRVATPVLSPRSGTLAPPVVPPTPGGPGGGTGGTGAPVAGANEDGAVEPAPLQVRSARLNRRAGIARLVLFCPAAAGLCEGTATIRADRRDVARRAFNQSGGARFPLTIRLSSAARRRIAGAKTVQELVLSRDATGVATRLTRTLRG